MMDVTGSLPSVPGSLAPHLTDHLPRHADGGHAAYFSRSLIEPQVPSAARIHHFIPAGGPDPGSAADTLLLDAPDRLSTTLIDLAFGRDGSIWEYAATESARTSDPADFIFGIGAVGFDVGTLPIARVVAMRGMGSDTLDMIFGGELMDAA